MAVPVYYRPSSVSYICITLYFQLDIAIMYIYFKCGLLMNRIISVKKETRKTKEEELDLGIGSNHFEPRILLTTGGKAKERMVVELL